MFKLAPEPTQRLYDEDDILQFGKYKGDTVGYIMKEDPLYLEYLCHESKFFNLKSEIKEKLFLLCAYEADIIDVNDSEIY